MRQKRGGLETSYRKMEVIHPTIGRQTTKKQLVSGQMQRMEKAERMNGEMPQFTYRCKKSIIIK